MNEIEEPSAIDVIPISQSFRDFADFGTPVAQAIVESRFFINVEHTENGEQGLDSRELEKPPNHHLNRHQRTSRPGEQSGDANHGKRKPRVDAVGGRELVLVGQRVGDVDVFGFWVTGLQQRSQSLSHDGVGRHEIFDLLSHSPLFSSLLRIVFLHVQAIVVVGVVVG